MSATSLPFRQFYPAPTTAPVPPIRDKNEHIVGGERLQSFLSEVEDLARVIFGTMRCISIAEAVRTMPQAHAASLEIVLKRREFTQAFTPAELKKMAEAEAQAKRNAANAKRYAAEAEAQRLKERFDRETKEKLMSFKPLNPSTQHGSPAYWIERANLVTELNNTRAAHGLPPLSV